MFVLSCRVLEATEAASGTVVLSNLSIMTEIWAQRESVARALFGTRLGFAPPV